MVRKDFEVDSQLQPKQTKSGQFGVVSGRDEFHQSVVVRLHDRYDEISTGAVLDDNTVEKLKVAATRVARVHEFIDEISQIDITNTPGEQTVEVSISYRSGEEFSEQIN